MKILVIEDDAATLDYIARGLEEAGDVVDRAAGGREGLMLGGSETYDVMIVDRYDAPARSRSAATHFSSKCTTSRRRRSVTDRTSCGSPTSRPSSTR